MILNGRAFPDERCAANRAAGSIVYRSSYDFAAAASIVDVLVAEQKGYYDELCLDVRVQPGFATENYALVADGTVQFSSAGSFSEVVSYDVAHPEAGLVAVAVEGKTTIDALVVKPGRAATAVDLRGATIGVKGTMTQSVQAMLAGAGLREGVDYTTVQIDGFDPLAHLALANVDGFTVFKSNEPGILDRAGARYALLDPSDTDIPGSFGIVYSSAAFLDAHPDAAVDFMRATMRGLAEAVADPDSASMIALDFIANGGNARGLTTEGETYRWRTESRLVADSTPRREPLGMPDRTQLQAEIERYAAMGLFGGKAPRIDGMYAAWVLDDVYDDSNQVAWPSTPGA
jgi:NitT/TauT family transport system substrate-binding protein